MLISAKLSNNKKLKRGALHMICENNNEMYEAVELTKKEKDQLYYREEIDRVCNERNKVTMVISILSKYIEREEELISDTYFFIINEILSSEQVNNQISIIESCEENIERYSEVIKGLETIYKEQDIEIKALIDLFNGELFP